MVEKRLPLTVLTEEELVQIEECAFRLLEEVGISLQHGRVTEMLYGIGCRINKGRAFLPREVVDQSMKCLTGAWTCRNRDGSNEFALGKGTIRFHNGACCPFTQDIDAGQRRRASLQDVADMTRLLDAIPNVDIILAGFAPQDVPMEIQAIAATRAMLQNTRKPIMGAGVTNANDVRYMVEMAAACCGGMESFRKRPTMPIGVSLVAPLRFTDVTAEAIVAAAESGAPFYPGPMPLMGASSPITLPGALAQQHAELLASFVIVAATRPGAAVIYTSRIFPIDMRSGVCSLGGPEAGMAGACATQLAHRLGLPCDTYGLASSSPTVDPQFAYERFANAVIPGMAGADLMSGIGVFESLLSGAHPVAVIDDEIIGYLKRILRGFEVNQDSLAFEVIREVAAGDSTFLEQSHTLREMRRGAVWVPSLVGRSRGTNEDANAGVVCLAETRAREILRTHEVAPLPEDVSRQLEEVMQRARRELLKA